MDLDSAVVSDLDATITGDVIITGDAIITADAIIVVEDVEDVVVNKIK